MFLFLTGMGLTSAVAAWILREQIGEAAVTLAFVAVVLSLSSLGAVLVW